MNNVDYTIMSQYFKFTEKMFDYLKNKVGRFAINARLNIVSYDITGQFYGTCSYPIDVYIYLGEILEGYNHTGKYVPYVKSIISQVLLHELLHVARVPNMDLYNNSQEYHTREETLADSESVMLLLNWAKEIYELFGFNIRFELFTHTIDGPYNNNGYEHTNLRDYYLMTIYNAFDISLKDFSNAFDSLDTIQLNISGNFGQDSVIIKYNGKYNPDTRKFAYMISDKVSINDKFKFDYGIYSDKDNPHNGTVVFNLRDESFYPIKFKN